MARAFQRVDLPGGGGGEGGTHCQGVRNIPPNLNSGRRSRSHTQQFFNLSQALVKLRPENAGEGGTVVKRVPCVERGLDNFRSIRFDGRVLLFDVL